MEDKKRIIKNHYEPLLAQYSGGYKILDWESRESQLKRFEVLTTHVDLSGKSLLDVGCGTGDLYGFLEERSVDVKYYGVDILEKMIGRALKNHPGGRFFTGDIFSESMFCKKQFDVVFCSGIFNLNMGDNESLLKAAFPVLFGYAKNYVVFNLLDPDHYIQSSRYSFFKPKEVLHWLRKYTDDARCITGYMQGDFTIVAKV